MHILCHKGPSHMQPHFEATCLSSIYIRFGRRVENVCERTPVISNGLMERFLGFDIDKWGGEGEKILEHMNTEIQRNLIINAAAYYQAAAQNHEIDRGMDR
jgi:hypothetical protein